MSVKNPGSRRPSNLTNVEASTITKVEIRVHAKTGTLQTTKGCHSVTEVVAIAVEVSPLLITRMVQVAKEETTGSSSSPMVAAFKAVVEDTIIMVAIRAETTIKVITTLTIIEVVVVKVTVAAATKEVISKTTTLAAIIHSKEEIAADAEGTTIIINTRTPSILSRV